MKTFYPYVCISCFRFAIFRYIRYIWVLLSCKKKYIWKQRPIYSGKFHQYVEISLKWYNLFSFHIHVIYASWSFDSPLSRLLGFNKFIAIEKSNFNLISGIFPFWSQVTDHFVWQNMGCWNKPLLMPFKREIMCWRILYFKP